MKLYTRKGDDGTTGMLSGSRIRKSDDRIELIGTIDELNSHLGLVKAAAPKKMKLSIEKIQRDLMVIMSGISDPANKNYRITEDRVEELESEIDRIEQLFERKKGFILYGGCELSARLDVARAVARRADRRFAKVRDVYGVHFISMEYMNRLSDYLYIFARYADHLEEERVKKEGHHCSCKEDPEHKGTCGCHEHMEKVEINEEQISDLVRQLLQEYGKTAE